MPCSHFHAQNTPLTGQLAATVSKLTAGTGSLVHYLGSHSFGNGNLAEANGRRLYLNAVMTPAGRPAACLLDLVLRTVCSVGDTVVVTQPSYHHMQGLMRAVRDNLARMNLQRDLERAARGLREVQEMNEGARQNATSVSAEDRKIAENQVQRALNRLRDGLENALACHATSCAPCPSSEDGSRNVLLVCSSTSLPNTKYSVS